MLKVNDFVHCRLLISKTPEEKRPKDSYDMKGWLIDNPEIGKHLFIRVYIDEVWEDIFATSIVHGLEYDSETVLRVLTENSIYRLEITERPVSSVETPQDIPLLPEAQH